MMNKVFYRMIGGAENILSNKNLWIIIVVLLVVLLILNNKTEKFDFYTMEDEKDDLSNYQYYDLNKPIENVNGIDDHNFNLNYLLIDDSCSN